MMVPGSDCIAAIGETFFREARVADVDPACAAAGDLPPFPLERQGGRHLDAVRFVGILPSNKGERS